MGELDPIKLRVYGKEIVCYCLQKKLMNELVCRTSNHTRQMCLQHVSTIQYL